MVFMHKLPRYVLFEFLKTLSATLLAATVLIIVVGLMQQAIREGLGIAQVVQLIPYILPDALRFTVPGAILFAACSVYGRLSAGNEIVAVKALGISPMRLIWPVLAVACLLSFAALWLNDLAVSWGSSGIRRVVVQSAEEIIYSVLRSRKSYSNDRLAIGVKRVNGRTLEDFSFTLRPGEGKPEIAMTAQFAELRTNPADDTLVVVLRNGMVSKGDVKMKFADTIEQIFNLPDVTTSKTRDSGPSQLPLRAIPGAVVRQKEKILELEQALAVKAACQMFSGQFDQLVDAQWQNDRNHLRDEKSQLARLYTEPHRRWANGFSCLGFVLVGIPLAIRLRNADFLKSFFICFLPILLVYYPLLMLGVDGAKGGSVPPQTVWLGNAILLLVGVWQMRRVLRY
jgi:lipopolysaccharide export system permease protein